MKNYEVLYAFVGEGDAGLMVAQTATGTIPLLTFDETKLPELYLLAHAAGQLNRIQFSVKQFHMEFDITDKCKELYPTWLKDEAKKLEEEKELEDKKDLNTNV